MGYSFATSTTHLMRCLLAAVVATLLSVAASPQAGGRFDLSGPSIDVHVQRGARSLPIAMVPNLLPGDRLLIHADLPPTQSVKLLMVVAFLRGSTNPPPNEWFTRIETWDKRTRAEGVTVTVPDEAQQALIFLAPDTGGGFATLKSAVVGRPGVFVRAAQDLNEAAFEQARIERYLQAIRRVPPGSPAELLDHSHKLAATLNLKPNEDCFKRPADQQLACLRQTGTQVLLDDGHGQTLASMLSNGDSANLIGAVASTPMANTGGAGAYSAYVGTVIDLVRLMSGLHTAHFQYIPAIAFPDEEALNLRLNTAPSFNNPKSVIVVALPAVQKSLPPRLLPQDQAHVSCLLQPSMVVPLQGAPLVFATAFAHDLVLHLDGATFGGRTDLPLVPDAFEGGLVLTDDKTDRKPLPVAAPEARDAAGHPATGATANRVPDAHSTPATSVDRQQIATDDSGAVSVSGTLRGMWGFDSFVGTSVNLQRRPGGGWTRAAGYIFAGKSNDLLLHADGTACTRQIELDLPGMQDQPLKWKQARGEGDRPAGALQVTLPLEKAAPGTVHLRVHQFGIEKVDDVDVRAYSDVTRLTALHVRAGEEQAILTGTGLAEVRSVKSGFELYEPAASQPNPDKELLLTHVPTTGSHAVLRAGDTGIAQATLADGRTLSAPYTIDAARPSVKLLSKTAKPDQTIALPLTLNSNDDLPLNARITFALRSGFPVRFPRSEKIEIALSDGSLHTMLNVSDGSLVLQDARTALAFFSPAKSFGPSAFGPMQLRAIAEDGTAGDWMPLGTLVRTPEIASVICTRISPHSPAPAKSDPSKSDDAAVAQAPEAPCTLTGRDLFLLDSIGADSGFSTAVPVAIGFAGDSLPVPRPADNHTLYLKLHDDPDALVTVPVSPAVAGTVRHGTTSSPTTTPAASP